MQIIIIEQPSEQEAEPYARSKLAPILGHHALLDCALADELSSALGESAEIEIPKPGTIVVRSRQRLAAGETATAQLIMKIQARLKHIAYLAPELANPFLIQKDT